MWFSLKHYCGQPNKAKKICIEKCIKKHFSYFLKLVFEFIRVNVEDDNSIANNGNMPKKLAVKFCERFTGIMA